MKNIENIKKNSIS